MAVELELNGKRVLITGAGQGVGRGLASAFAEAGAHVLVNDLRAERAQAVVDEIVSAGGAASAAAFDVTEFDSVVGAFDSAGLVDVLVNNAGNAGAEGITDRLPFAQTGPQDWEPYLRVNLYGVLNCTRAALPAMIENRWGRVITVVSDAGRTGDQNGAAYAASKAAAAGLTRSLALENGRYGVTVNNIALGTMRTPLSEPLWAEGLDTPQAKAVLRNYVVRRPGSADDVSYLAVLLASARGEWITGQTIPVNGGYSFAL